jgi:peptidoglycan/LPS O-acetylase OafA/YrhL
MGSRELVIPYVVGTIGLAAAWLIPVPASSGIIWLGSLSYGIYLVHPLVASLVGRATGRPGGTMLAILVAAVSAVLVAATRRGPLRAVM